MTEPPALAETQVGLSHKLHLFHDPEDGTWSVWLDTEIQERDGICIAVAKTKNGALGEAGYVLRCASVRIKQLENTKPPEWMPFF